MDYATCQMVVEWAKPLTSWTLWRTSVFGGFMKYFLLVVIALSASLPCRAVEVRVTVESIRPYAVTIKEVAAPNKQHEISLIDSSNYTNQSKDSREFQILILAFEKNLPLLASWSEDERLTRQTGGQVLRFNHFALVR